MALIRLTDLIRVKTMLGMADTETEFDERLYQFIDEITAEMELELDRKFEIKSRTQFFDVKFYEMQSFALEAYPNITGVQVFNDSDRLFPGNSLIDAADYSIDQDTGTIYIDRSILTPGSQALKVIYSGGMGTDQKTISTNFPGLTSAATMEVAARWQRKSTLGLIAVTQSGGSVTIAQKAQFLPMVQAILDLFKRYTGG